MKKIVTLMALFVISLLTLSMVGAVGLLPVEVQELRIDGKSVGANENLYVEEGDALSIEVKLKNTGTTTLEDLEVEAAIKGYEYSDYESVSDSTHVFDLDAGDTMWVDLDVNMPVKLDKDLYLLRVTITDKNSDAVIKTYNLKVNPTRHGLDIKDVVFSPGTTVTAGHSLLTTVLIDNFGGKDEDDVKVTLEISELGLTASDYITNLGSDDKKTSEELFLKLPVTAAAGEYTAKVSLTYDEGYETVTKNYKLTVLANEKAGTGEKLVLTVGPEAQNVVAGQQATFPVALTNAGTVSKSYLLELAAGDWATSQMSENLVVLEPGKTKVVYAYLTPVAKAGTGEHTATLTVKAAEDNSVLKTVSLKANVVEGGCNLSLRNGLEIALIVLVALLVIVGLILGFSRLRKDKEDEETLGDEGEDKTYY
ncbi:MAG: hypothetical protein ABIA37_03485 [Candidatus Woesearchaeota archaeon]